MRNQSYLALLLNLHMPQIGAGTWVCRTRENEISVGFPMPLRAEVTGAVSAARYHTRAVADEAADDRGRKGQWYADRLRQAVYHTRERNPDQSRDRDDDDISLQQHGEPFRGACEQGGAGFGATRLDIKPPSMRAGKSQTKTFCVRN
jgi:hypothetical protein